MAPRPHDGPGREDDGGPEQPQHDRDHARDQPDREQDPEGDQDHERDGLDAPPRREPDRPDDLDVDAQWRGIVDRLGPLGEPPADEVAGGDDPDDDPTGDDPGLVPPLRRVVRPVPAPGDPRSWAPDPAVEEAEDHFVPPDPGPVLGGDPLLTMAWALVLGVPALVVVSVIARLDLPSVVLQVAAALFAAALGVLVWRMPRGGPDDPRDGPGAVV